MRAELMEVWSELINLPWFSSFLKGFSLRLWAYVATPFVAMSRGYTWQVSDDSLPVNLLLSNQNC